ncbi:cell envelope integrity protein TolA [Marinospirillum perlucidum]|uniref:cell envelope integrity protein TolA n=1 Tax=Marinospirillum perlucidum TaxID=1982602 RepID=UPI001FE70941|nr:cell envelope integrity protein TolA [Marinospirillum perlucidum]
MRPANLSLSLILALLVHLVALGLLFWQGLQMYEPPEVPSQEIIRATIISEDPAQARQQEAAEQERRRQAEARRRQREAEEARQRAEEEARRQQEEAARRQAEQERQAEAERQRRLQEQREAELQAQQEAEQQRQLQIQREREEAERLRTEAERQRQLEERIRQQVEAERAAEARRQREEEARIRAESQRQREAALAEQAAADAQARARMEGIIFNRVSEQWTRPPGVTSDLRTVIQVRLLGTGELAPDGITLLESSGNDAFDRSAIQAIERAVPFPLLQLEPRQRNMFRELDLIFTPEDLMQ